MIGKTLLSLLILAAPAAGETVYDNTATYTSFNGFLSGAEWADDVHLTKGGDVDQIQFGYISNGSTQATIRFYTNDAGNSSVPVTGTQFHTEVVAIPGGGASGLKVVDLSTPVTVPADMWMSIQFNGSSGTMRLYDPPVVGTSNNNLVVHVPSGWAADAFGPGRNNFQFGLRIQSGPVEWADLGQGLSGSVGVPALSATGSLAAGTPFAMNLSNAKADAPAYLVLSATQANIAFMGGVLVPNPDIVLPITTNALGQFSIAGTTPGGLPSGVSIFVQTWVVDAAGSAGFAASNARTTTTP